MLWSWGIPVRSSRRLQVAPGSSRMLRTTSKLLGSTWKARVLEVPARHRNAFENLKGSMLPIRVSSAIQEVAKG
eukprot:8321862-Pyramimonas_sp.AAC.1